MGAEVRWVVLGLDGRHATLCRHREPSQDEIRGAEAALRAAGGAAFRRAWEAAAGSRATCDGDPA